MSPEPPLMPGGFRPEGRPAMLEILGQSHDGDRLWVRINGNELDFYPYELAKMRQEAAIYGNAVITNRRFSALMLDESQLDILIKAMNASQPLYPPIPCRFCGVDASVLIEDEPYCHAHAAGYTAREERQ